MDLLKTAFFVVMVAALGLMWVNRDFVTDAYSQSESPTEIRFSGVDLAFETSEIPASPYVVHVGEDTRRRPLSLIFTDNRVDEPIEMSGGEARIEGSVRYDGKPAAGGTVRLERHTSEGVGTIDVPINNEGWYRARSLPGGRYRVRAWVPGAATMTESVVFFVADDGAVTQPLTLQEVDPEPIVEFVNGGPMYLGLAGSFGVVVSQHRVDNDGIIVTRPIQGAYIEATFSSEVDLHSSPIQVTNGDGLVQYHMRCNRIGSGYATVTFDSRVLSAALPPCRAIPTTTAPPTTETVPSSGQGGPSTTVPATQPSQPPTTSQTAPPSSGGGNG